MDPAFASVPTRAGNSRAETCHRLALLADRSIRDLRRRPTSPLAEASLCLMLVAVPMMNAQKARVALICTGGTISMRFDPVSGGVIPALSGEALLALVPDLMELAEIRVVNISLLPGPHMTPRRMLELTRFIRAHLNSEEQDAVVVTHGTDTLEECAYVASLVLASPKPVVFVGAMRNSSEPGWDGPANLRAALRVSVAAEARGLGVLVVMSNRVLSAQDAVKSHTEALDAFQGRDQDALGGLDPDRVSIWRRPALGEPLRDVDLDEKVEIVKLSAGSDGRVIEFLTQNGFHGLVLEALGLGNVPLPAVDRIDSAVKTGLPVVLTSRCPRGPVQDLYAYAGGGRRLREMGVILGGLLPSHKARLKLMLLLGAGCTLPEIRAAFEDPQPSAGR